jgi:hypothetical protein
MCTHINETTAVLPFMDTFLGVSQEQLGCNAEGLLSDVSDGLDHLGLRCASEIKGHCICAGFVCVALFCFGFMEGDCRRSIFSL